MKKSILLLAVLSIFNLSFAIAGGIKGTVKDIDGGLGNAVVYIEKIKGKTFPPPEKPAVLDQIDLTFVPHVLPVVVGTTVTFPNNDVTRHNVFSPSKVKKFDLGTYPLGSTKTVVFDKPGVIAILCHVHHEMSAFIIVVETVYFVVSDQKGKYQINNVPSGKYRLAVWHEEKKLEVRKIEVPDFADITVNFLMEE